MEKRGRIRLANGKEIKCKQCRTVHWQVVGTSNCTCANGHETIIAGASRLVESNMKGNDHAS